jgi:uncharacterized membrane protein
MFDLLGLFVILLIFGALIALIVAISRSNESLRTARSLENQISALHYELSHLTKRIYDLEKSRDAYAQSGQPRPEPSAEKISPQQPAAAPPAPVPAAQAPTATPTAVHPTAPSSPLVSPAPVVMRVPAPPPKSPATTPTAQVPSFTTFSSADSSRAGEQKKPRQWADLEERLGTNWLNKIGTAAFVIGVALLLNYSMHYLGPVGKIVLGYVLSAILLAVGMVGERKERYRVAGRAVLGGGWALVYFTTYAMHNIAAVRIVQSATLGFALLFAVSVAMIAHSLRYRSQVTTGFAYLLAFVSVGVGQIPFGALVATLLLAASLIVILRARGWFILEPLAIIATYTLHWIWLNQIYEAIGGHKPFPQLIASIALLTAYWALYLVSYFLRNPVDAQQTQLLTASFLLNAAGYLFVLHQESFHPAWRFWFLLAAGAVYVAISAFSRKINRRLSFILASTLGVALLLAAIPFRYSGGNLEILWLIEVEALLIVGWRLPDSHLRNLGWAGAAVLASYAGFNDLAPRFAKWQPPNGKSAWLMIALAAAFYSNARLRAWLGEDATAMDDFATAACPPIATAFALAAAWFGLPFVWIGLVWMIIGVALVQIGRRISDRNLSACGHVAAAAAVFRLLVVNLEHPYPWHQVSLRLVTVGLSCALLYFFSRRTAPLKQSQPSAAAGDSVLDSIQFSDWLPAIYTGTATFLVTILLWDEVTAAAVAVAWGIFALALFETAQFLNDRPVRLEAYVVLAASFARIFIADLNSTSYLGRIPVPVVTVAILAAIYYYVASGVTDSRRIRSAFLWLGTISLAALFRFEVPIEWVAVSWAAFTVVLYSLGRYLRSRTFFNQCYAMTLAVAARCAFDNLYQTGRWHFTTVRVVTVVSSAALLYALFAAAKLAPRAPQPESPQRNSQSSWKHLAAAWSALERRPQHLFFFVATILITALVSVEARRGFLTAAWGVEALIVFLAVLKMDERAYRWFSLGLFMLCVVRIVTVDVWNLDALGRIVSFLGLGVALLAVSFLYARHREILRKVL